MIDAPMREHLRQQALAAWEKSKQLRHETESIHRRTKETLRSVEERRRRQADRDARHFEVLVDTAIRGLRRSDEMAKGGVGLAASINLPRLVLFQELLGKRVSFLVGAGDAGTAMGLSITHQPDLAIVDERLLLTSGSDFVLSLPTFAPRTKALLLTDDPEAAKRVRLAGFDVQARNFSEKSLTSWIVSGASW